MKKINMLLSLSVAAMSLSFNAMAAGSPENCPKLQDPSTEAQKAQALSKSTAERLSVAAGLFAAACASHSAYANPDARRADIVKQVPGTTSTELTCVTPAGSITRTIMIGEDGHMKTALAGECAVEINFASELAAWN